MRRLLPVRPRLGRATVAVLVAAAAVLLVRGTVVETVRVSGESMSPTLHDGDVVLVSRTAGAPGRGDLVTFTAPDDGQPAVKRVVGVSGDVVEIRDAVLTVDGVVVAEDYVDPATIDGLYYGPVTVPEASVLVLGDEREGSIDSRSYGVVGLDALRGRVLTRLW